MTHPLKDLILLPDSDDEEMQGATYTFLTEPPWMNDLFSDARSTFPAAQDTAPAPLGATTQDFPVPMGASPTLPWPNGQDAGEQPPVGAFNATPENSPERKRARAARGESGNTRGVNHIFTYNAVGDELNDFATNVEKRNQMFPLHSDFQYIEYALERGAESGLLHVHGYVRVKQPLRKTETQMVKYFGNCRGIHFGGEHGKTFGTPETMLKYVRKGRDEHDPTGVAGPWSKGEVPTDKQRQGHRSDLDQALEVLKTSRNLRQVAILCPKTFVRTERGLKAWLEVTEEPPPRERPMTTICLWGKAGCGKTWLAEKIASTRNLSIYKPPAIASAAADAQLWCNYRAEKVLFLDEFDWRKWDIHFFKQVTDKYILQLTARYHNHYAAWELVVICANDSPTTWWTGPESARLGMENIRAIFRRLGSNCYKKTTREQDSLDKCEHTPRFSDEDGTPLDTGIF